MHPAIGTSGPSSRSIFKASGKDRGCNSERCVIEPAISDVRDGRSTNRKNRSESTYRRNRGDREDRREGRLLRKIVHLSDDALPGKVSHVEIQQQPDFMITQLQIGQNLRQMKGKQFLHRLQFDDDAIFDKEVDPIAGVNVHAVVNDRKPGLMLKGETILSELVTQARVVGALEASSAERCKAA